MSCITEPASGKLSAIAKKLVSGSRELDIIKGSLNTFAIEITLTPNNAIITVKREILA
jgi:hypothetical protein